MKTAAEWIEYHHEKWGAWDAPTDCFIEAIQQDVIASLGFTNPEPGPHGLPDPFPGVPLNQMEGKAFPTRPIQIHAGMGEDERMTRVAAALNHALAGSCDMDIRFYWSNVPDQDADPCGGTGVFFIRLTRIKNP